MNKKETEIKITERFKDENLDRRRETLEKLFYNLIKIKEHNVNK